jgi:SNF2 family DNA or RNA helicase
VEIPVASLTARMDRMKYDLLENYLSELGFSDGIMEEEGHVLSFFKMDFTKLKKLTNVYLSESLKRKELRSIGKQVIRVSYKNNLVNVFLEKSEYDESDMEKIIQALRRKKKYILLSGDRIIDLDSAAAKDLGETVGDFGMDPKDLYRKKTISMVTAIKAFSHEKSCSIDKYLRDMIGEIRSFKDAEVSVPKLQGELRDYQIEGFKWLSVLSKYRMGGILADDMGLGKTIQIIALIRSDRTGKPSLVVCPKSLVFNWISEFACFDATTRVTAIYGPESKRSETIASIHYNEKAVYITSYESLRNDIEKYSGAFQYAILDEAQFIKNIHAQKTRSVKEIRAQHRFALTGTPIENSVVDLWSIFDFIMPGYFEELTQFKDRDTADIARKAAPFILRRVKEDVLEDLPSKYERILSADMSNGQRKLYEAMRLDARRQLTDGGKAFDILPYLTRLRQLCVDPALVVDDYSAGSGKMDMLKTLIPEYLQNNHRILIFSQFVKALEEVQDMLTNLGISTYFLSGATSAKDRVQMMDSFNNGSGTDVFLISLKAGGTGLNLTGADTVIHLDPWWNVAAEDQASDRAHRIGQTRNVEVIKLIAADSIEQRVLELQNIKKEVISKVISDNDGSVTSASLEDIAFVLE